MKNIVIVFLCLFFSQTVTAEEKTIILDPNQIEINGYVHESLPQDMLERIKSTTDTFEIVDGISYEEAVDLYKRDLDPESNLIIWEEMARVYKFFCKNRCTATGERKEVYRALLLRSMFSNQKALEMLRPQILSIEDSKFILSQYKLEAKPINAIQKQ